MGFSQLTLAEARARSAALSVREYDVELDLTDGQGAAADRVFRSTTAVVFTSESDTTFLDVDPERLLRVEVDGVALTDPQVRDTRLHLSGIAGTTRVVVEAEFALRSEHQGLQKAVDPADGEVYFTSMAFMTGARHIYASFDQPDLKAPFTLTVTAPAAWEVVSNGPVVDRSPAPGGAQRWRFAPTQPLATYLIAVLAGPFERTDRTVPTRRGPLRLGVLYPRGSRGHLDVERCLRWTADGMTFFEDLFDAPYPFDKYDQVFTLEPGDWAMEHAGAVTFGSEFLVRAPATDVESESLAYTLLHELSHMWFGDLVTARWWEDTWLQEAFATYAGYVAMAEVTEHTGAWTTFGLTAKVAGLEADQLPSTHPISTEVPDLQVALANFDHVTYEKGAAVLRQLAAWLGPEAFAGGLRAYVREHAFANASLGDLLACLAEASGRDVPAWAGDWLLTSGVSTLATEIQVDAAGVLTDVAIVHTGPGGGPPRHRHRLTLGAYDGADTLRRVHRVDLEVSGARTPVPELVGRPAPAALVLNDEDLTFAKIRLDPRSRRRLLDDPGALADPLAGSVVWTAWWDMVRDGELAADDYVAAVLRGGPAIGHVVALNELLGNAERAVDKYAGGSREALNARFAAACWQQATEAGSDDPRRHEWLRAFARSVGGTAHEETALALLRGSGPEAIAGAVDFDLRWELVRSLARSGALDEAAIDAELRRDDNATSLHRAAIARAGRPSAEAKAAAWQLITTDDGGQVSLKYAAARGFWCTGQAELLLDWVPRFYEEADRFWELDNGGEHARAATQFLVPRLVHPAVVEQGRAWLAGDGHAATLSRFIGDAVAEAERSLRNREVSDRAGA